MIEWMGFLITFLTFGEFEAFNISSMIDVNLKSAAQTSKNARSA